MNWTISRRRFLAALSYTTALLNFPKSRIWAAAKDEPQGEVVVWFDQPAKHWGDALPVGNGRLGAMVFGDPHSERLALNEDTLWSGFPRDWNNPGAKAHLPVVRDLVLKQKDYPAADVEVRKMEGPYNQAFEPLGDLALKLEHSGEVRSYRRSLDLDSAIAQVSYEVDGCQFTREIFSSSPDQVIVIRLLASKAAQLNCDLLLTSQLRAKSESTDSGEITMMGKAPSESAPNYLNTENPVQYDEAEGKGMQFAAILKVQTPDGKISQLPDGGLRIQGATSAVIYIGAATGFRGFASAPDKPLAEIVAAARKPVVAATNRSYEKIQQEHVADHRSLFRRVALDLSDGNNSAGVPTDQRVKNFAANSDPSLLALYFNYGRYLLMGSSRPSTQPANLQGIWS